MRYYSIIITNPQTGAIIRPAPFASLGLPASYTSFVNGRSIPGAQNIELDFPVFNFSTPMGRAWLRVWGISIQEIAQAQDLVGCNISVYGGMQAGLPLANPKQAGLLVQGQIYQALGNWEGLDQTLDLFIYPNVGTSEDPKNIVLTWPANTTLASALQVTCQNAFPTLTPNIAISDKIVQPRTDVGTFASLDGLAQWCRDKSVEIVGGSYIGVAIAVKGSEIKIYDNGVAPPDGQQTKAIAFQDLIGQPTWIDAPTISFKTVMRADIAVGDYIQMSGALATATPGSLIGTPLRAKPTFAGTFQIQIVRHLGNFRQPDASSWVTVFNAYPVPFSTSDINGPSAAGT